MPGCMTEESDSENGEKILTHQLLWRSECKNTYVERYLCTLLPYQCSDEVCYNMGVNLTV